MFLQKWSKIAKIGHFGGFQCRETRENPYVLALIQGLCRPKNAQKSPKLAILVVSKAAELRKIPTFLLEFKVIEAHNVQKIPKLAILGVSRATKLGKIPTFWP